MEEQKVKYEYTVKQFTCKKCGVTYVIESDSKIADIGKCSQCQLKKGER